MLWAREDISWRLRINELPMTGPTHRGLSDEKRLLAVYSVKKRWNPVDGTFTAVDMKSKIQMELQADRLIIATLPARKLTDPFTIVNLKSKIQTEQDLDDTLSPPAGHCWASCKTVD